MMWDFEGLMFNVERGWVWVRMIGDWKVVWDVVDVWVGEVGEEEDGYGWSGMSWIWLGWWFGRVNSVDFGVVVIVIRFFYIISVSCVSFIILFILFIFGSFLFVKFFDLEFIVVFVYDFVFIFVGIVWI